MANWRKLTIICSMLVMSCAGAPKTGGLMGGNQTQEGRGLHYTCRDDAGELIITTEKEVAESTKYVKSRVFIESTPYTPVDITDYDPKKAGEKEDFLEFLEDVVEEKLSREAENWPVGTFRTLSVNAETQDHLAVNNREIELSRTKTLPKEKIYDKSVFTAMTKSKAAVGEPVNLHFGVQGRVVDVRENEVEVHFVPESEKPLEGPFGPVVVHDMGDSLMTEIVIRTGDLVKMGPAIVGQVADVGDSTFRVNYSHPFGGRTLTCDVAVKALDRDLVQEVLSEDVGFDSSAMAVQENSGFSAATASTAEDITSNSVVEVGDLVKVAYTVTLESGELLRTTEEDVALNPDQKKYVEFWQDTFGAETVIAGSPDDFPGLGYAVRGLNVGKPQQVVVPPEEAFGIRELQQVFQYDRERIIPTSITMSAKVYTDRFGGFPTINKILPYNSYVNAQIVDVTENGAAMKLVPVKEEINDVFGTTRMEVVEDNIHMYLTPRIGADFELDEQKGRVVSVDSQKFTVDFNDPLAGKNIVYDINVLELTKAGEFSGVGIKWIEDYEEGMKTVESMNKPAVLFLYADWCSYCKKMETETLVDPRTVSMKDDFVWIMVNSDENKDIATLYEQTSFPLTVMLDDTGDVIGTISGYRAAKTFREEITKALSDG